MVGLPQKARELVDGKNFASVATLMKDGSPHVTTTWVDREGDTVLVNTTENRVKTRNVRRDPRIAVGVYRLSDPYDAVYIRGVVRSISKAGAEEHIDRLSHKYVGADYRQHGDRVILRIEPLRVFVQKP